MNYILRIPCISQHAICRIEHQAFVPLNKLDEYKDLMEKVFGSGSCYILSVRPVGGVEL